MSIMGKESRNYDLMSLHLSVGANVTRTCSDGAGTVGLEGSTDKAES